MKQQKFRVMHKDTGKVKEVTKAWLDIAKEANIWKDYEMIGPVEHDAVVIPSPINKIQREIIGVQIVNNEEAPVLEPELNKEDLVAEEPKKSKRGRKSKQK